MRSDYQHLLSRCISYIYPDADPSSDFVVLDRHEGPYIAQWNLSEPKPTEEQLDEALLEVLKKDKKGEFKGRAVHEAIALSPDSDVESLEDLFLLVLPALYLQSAEAAVETASVGGETPQTDLSAMAGNFDRYYLKKAQIEAATSEEEIAAVSWEG